MVKPELHIWFDLRCRSIRELIEIEEYSRAEKNLKELLQTWPDHPILSLIHADIATNTGKYTQAYRSLEAIYLQDPSSYPALENLGRSLSKLGYYHTAISFLEPFSIRIGREHSDAQFWLVFSWIMTGKTQIAASFLSQMKETYGEGDEMSQMNASLQALSGLIACANGNLEEAKDCGGIAAATYPSAPLVAYLNGTVATQEGDLPNAIRWLSRAIEDDRHLMQARNDLKQVYEGADDTEKAQSLGDDIAGFLRSASTMDESLLAIRELTLAGKGEEAAVLARSLSSEDLDDRGRLGIAEALLSAGYGAEVLEVAGGITSPLYSMNLLYLQVMAALQSGNASLAMEYLVSVSLRDRVISLYNLYRYAALAGLKVPDPDGESVDPAISALILFCLKGPEEAAPFAMEAVDSIQSPYSPGFAALVLSLSGRFDEAFRYAAIAESAGPKELHLIRPVILRYAGLLDEACVRFLSVCEEHPDLQVAKLLLIQTYLDRGKWGYAFEKLWKEGDLPSGLPFYKPMLIESRIRSGQVEDSDEITLDIIRETPFRLCDLNGTGHALILNHRFEKALWCFAEHYRIFDTDDEDTLVHLLQCLIRSGFHAEAYSHARVSAPESGVSLQILFLAAVAALLGGAPSRAEEILDEMVVSLRSEEILRDHLRHLVGQGVQGAPLDVFAETPAGGIAMTWLGEYAAAAERLEEEIEQISDDPGLRLAYGECLLHLGRYADALRQVRSAEKICGGADARISALIDQCRNRLFFERMGPDVIDQVLIPATGSVSEVMISVLYNLGIRLEEAGEEEEARAVFTRITEITPPDKPSVGFFEMQAEAFHSLGDILDDTSLYDLAVKRYDLAIRQDSGCARLYAGKGIVLCNPGRYQEAEVALREAIRLDPACGKAYSGLAWCLSETGRVQAAEYYGDRAVAFAPEDWGAWNNRALARLAAGNIEGAESDFRKAVFLAPDEMIAVGNLHQTLVATADDDAVTIRRDATVRFGPRIADRLDGNQKMNERVGAPVFDYDHPEVM